MAVRIRCDEPALLLKKIENEVASRKIKTWIIDDEGDFTHEPLQWRNQAWFRASISEDYLSFLIMGSKRKSMSRAAYAVFHGRFIEMLLSHFDSEFLSVRATAEIVKGENLGGSESVV